MITKNFKNLLATVICKGGTTYGGLQCKNLSGDTVYIATSLSSFPSNTPTTDLASSATSSGFHIGTGNSPETDESYALDNRIASGIGLSVNVSHAVENGKIYMIFDLTITNTSNAEITIREIGYAQYIGYTTAQGGSSTLTSRAFLLDRTVLANPVSIAAGEFATIRYKIGCSV